MLFSAHSHELLIEREEFPKGLRELRRFAKDSPAQLNDPAGVLAAKSFPDALATIWWQPDLDEYGDIRGLEYIADKLPAGADGVDPLLRVLTKVTTEGVFVFSSEGEHVDIVQLKRGRLLDVWRSLTYEQIDRPPLVTPGSSVVLRFRVNNTSSVPAPQLRLSSMWSDFGVHYYDAETTERPPKMGIEVVDAELTDLAIGQERQVTVSLSPAARGPILLIFSQVTKPNNGASLCLRLDADTPLHEMMGWKITHQKGTDTSRLFRPPDERRALRHAQRFARRHVQRPGGEFLAPVVDATSLDDAFAAVGLDKANADRQLRFTRTELPGSERLFWGFMEAVAVFANRHHGADITLRFAHAPDRAWNYRIDDYSPWRRVQVVT